MTSEKKKIDVTQIVCLAIGILVGMVLVQAVFGIGGILGGALGGGLGAVIGMVVYTLIGGVRK